MSNNTVIIAAPQKSVIAAYLLWFFLGSLGVHKFYLRQNLAGATYLGLYVLGWLTVWFFVGYLFFGLLAIGLIVDIFTIPSRVDRVNRGDLAATAAFF